MKTAVTISIEKKILDAMRSHALANRRTLSAQIETLWEESGKKSEVKPAKK